MRFIPITTLLIGAALLLLGRQLAERRKINETVGLSLSLCVIALGLALVPNNWQVWLAGGETGDGVLTFARELGLTGLFFLAGTRFDANEIWKARRSSFFVAATGALLLSLVAILLPVVGVEDRGAVIVTAAVIAGTSLWLPSQISLASEKGAIAAAPARGAAAAFIALSMLAVHFYAISQGQAGSQLSASAYTVVVLYELVKLAVFFSFAYFVATRFPNRAEGRVSPTRIGIGYLLMAALIFTLARSVISPLGGAVWSFIAGALFVRRELGRRMAETVQPVVVAVLLSFAFLPLLLQSHGRILTDKTLVFSVVIAALAFKFAVVWAGTRMAGVSDAEARRIAAATLASGEIGILLLGFGVTKWAIDGQFYFGILTFAFISMLLGTILWRFTSSEVAIGERDGEAQTSGAQRRSGSQFLQRAMTMIIITGAGLLALGSIARAQSPATASGDDPVARAMERIRMTVDAHAEAADRALAASKLVKESAEAKKQGKRDQARGALEKAEQIIREAASTQRGFLTEELLRRVASERDTLDPKPVTATFQPLPIAQFDKAIPKPVLARYTAYREPLARILEEEKVPPELLAVALVESGFNPLALSPKGARGIWQFMPRTAAAYGLAAGPMNDHRTHPEHSTRAAARYLRDLYQQFGDWKLALAAYNWGETKVQQVIDRTGIRDFDEMARRGLLPLETRNYVPAVLALWSQMSVGSAGGKAVDLPRKAQAQRRNNIIFAGATVRHIGVTASSAATAKQ